MLVPHLLAISLTTAAAAAEALSTDHVDQKCTPSTFSHLLPPGGSVIFTQAISTNGTFSDPTNGTNFELPSIIPQLPALCAVKFSIPSSQQSQVDFALFLPRSWNERYMAVGNGGFSGSIVWSDMAAHSHSGFAVMSTNTGHYSGTLDASWALNDTETKIDWGHRAMHLSVALSKQIVKGYYGHDVSYSYFSSCSNGGRQALKELTRYPDDFDGIIAGAPAWSLSRLFTHGLLLQLRNLLAPIQDQLSPKLLDEFQREAVRQCDSQDGVTDGIIGDPLGCHFYPEKLLCDGTLSTNSTCFSAPQLNLLYNTLNDWVDVNQTFVHPTLELGANFSVLVNYGGLVYGAGYLLNFVYNTTAYGPSDFKYFETVKDAEAINPGDSNVNYEVDEFRARGGKLIQYHGLADELIPAKDTIYWHSQIQQSLQPRGLSLDDWYKMYLVPGMAHCSLTTQNAPWYFGAAAHQYIAQVTTPIPGIDQDAKHDIVRAMMDWVENGTAPEELIATRFKGDVAANGVEKQRPICPYPQQAVYSHEGDVNSASSWKCC